MNEQLIKKLLDRKESGAFRELFVPDLEKDFFPMIILAWPDKNQVQLLKKKGLQARVCCQETL